MDLLINLISASLPIAPLILALALALGGFGLPISEDLVVIFAGVLAAKHTDLAISIYLGVFLGAYLGDAITYWLGRYLGVKLLETKFWRNKISKEKLNLLAHYFAKNAYLVILLGRFIPFGMRILIYLTAGFSKFDYKKFALIDAIAVLCTTSLTFSLSYLYGDNIIYFLNQAKYIIFSLVIFYILYLVFRHFLAKKRENQNTDQSEN